MWPEAGQDSYLYPNQISEQDSKAELQGEVLTVTLKKTASGIGFTIIGGDHPGQSIWIGRIVGGSVADRNRRLQRGDVLVRINGISILTYMYSPKWW